MIRFLQTPGPVKKVVLSGILLVFCGAMVITLIPGGLGSNLNLGAPGSGVIAKVGGADVTRAEVVRQAQMMVKQQFPRGNANLAQFLPFFATQAAERLITQKALLVEAERMGLRVTDEELADELQHGQYGSVFFPGGTFIGKDRYEDMLQQANLTIPQFEQGMKDDIMLRKLRSLVAGSASVSEREIRQEFEKRNAKVKFEYAVISQTDVQKSIKPTEAELKAFYERNKAAYANSVPEKRKLAYVVVDSAKVAAATPVSNDELQSYYQQHRDEYRVPEQVNVRHILIRKPAPGPDGKVDQKAVDAAKAKAEDVLKQIKAGGDFAALAKKYSDDPTGKSGGSVGWMQHGGFPGAADKAAFSLPKGGTSDVVDAVDGFDIIRVDDKQASRSKSFDEVKDQIEPILKQQKAGKAAESQANALLAQARSGGLDKAASSKGWQVTTSDYISRTDTLPGIGRSPQFMEAVFAQAPKAAPDLVQVEQGYAIFQVLDMRPAATPTFEQVRDRVKQEFTTERTGSLLAQKTQELSDRAKAAHDLKKAAKELGASLKTSELVGPDGQVPLLGSMGGAASSAFSLKAGEISGPISNTASGAVLQLLEKQQPTDQEFVQKKDEIRDELVQQKQGEIFGLFMENLRKQMEASGKIKVNKEEMQSLTKAAAEEGE